MRQWPLLIFFASVLCFAQQSQKPAPETREVDILAPECTPQKPRFPPAYGKFSELGKAASGERTHAIAQKHADSGINIEAMVQEIDLDGDGACDVVVSVRDPISTGGDSDVLSTLYLARKGRWLRVGAQSAKKTDRPAQFDLIQAGKTWQEPLLTSDAEIYEIGKPVLDQNFIAKPISIRLHVKPGKCESRNEIGKRAEEWP
jgi:hypothetical protein